MADPTLAAVVGVPVSAAAFGFLATEAPAASPPGSSRPAADPRP